MKKALVREFAQAVTNDCLSLEEYAGIVGSGIDGVERDVWKLMEITDIKQESTKLQMLKFRGFLYNEFVRWGSVMEKKALYYFIIHSILKIYNITWIMFEREKGLL